MRKRVLLSVCLLFVGGGVLYGWLVVRRGFSADGEKDAARRLWV